MMCQFTLPTYRLVAGVVLPLLQLTMAATVAPSLGAQGSSVQVRRFTVEDGLAQNDVRSVVQDRTGFLWVGTRRGLQRFDGYTFTRYASLDPSAPDELSSSITGLAVDARGLLWVATPRGLFRTDSTFRHVTPLRDAVGPWTLDAEQRFWFVDAGIVKSIEMHGDSSIAQHATTAARCEPCSAIAVANGNAWLAVPGTKTATVNRVDLTTGKLASFSAANAKDSHALLIDGAGRVWLSASDGLEVLEPGARRFRSLDFFRGRRPTNLTPDGRGGFFVATDAWLVRIDETGQVTEQWNSPEVFGIGVYPISLSVDREGGVWLASLTSGLIRLDLTRPPFDYRSSRSVPRLPLGNDFISATFERSDGTLWVGTFSAGVYRISPDWTEVRTYRHDPRDSTSLASDQVWDLQEDAQGNMWVGTSGGLCKNVGNGFHCHGIEGLNVAVTDIERDGGRFWIAIEPIGVKSFDPISDRFGPSVPGLSDVGSNMPVISLFRDSSFLWIGKGGLFRARVENGSVVGSLETIRLGKPAMPYDFHRDRRGALWVASDEGLQRWTGDAEHGDFSLVEVPELHGTSVFSIAEDPKGRLWLGTAHGLVQYSADRGTARRYGRRDGFLSGELNRRAALRRKNGEMLFGGIEGLTQFDPEFITGAHQPAPVALTRWRKVTANGPTEDRIDGLNTLRLEPNERAFTVEFAALSFAPSVARRYRYRLDPLNSDWIETTDHLATYSTPKPGRYVFQVQTASGPEAEWSTPGSVVTMDVIPPFWGTTWFRTLLVLFFFGLLWMAHKLRLRQALATERLRLRISRDLHDEIGAGLSSIALLTDSVGSTGTITDPDRRQLQRVARSARDMVADLRDIVWAIDPDSDKLEDVVSRMKDVASDLLREVQVSFHAPSARELGERITMSARRDLLLLFKELLHNVARHSRASSVKIVLDMQRDHLELEVSDNGIGFDPNDVRSGTGLKSLRERAARLGGRLDVSSERGRGTTARLSVPRT
jgi:ligand-binding sensor domain-containing protein